MTENKSKTQPPPNTRRKGAHAVDMYLVSGLVGELESGAVLSLENRARLLAELRKLPDGKAFRDDGDFLLDFPQGRGRPKRGDSWEQMSEDSHKSSAAEYYISLCNDLPRQSARNMQKARDYYSRTTGRTIVPSTVQEFARKIRSSGQPTRPSKYFELPETPNADRPHDPDHTAKAEAYYAAYAEIAGAMEAFDDSWDKHVSEVNASKPVEDLLEEGHWHSMTVRRHVATETGRTQARKAAISLAPWLWRTFNAQIMPPERTKWATEVDRTEIWRALVNGLLRELEATLQPVAAIEQADTDPKKPTP
ncbi:hypothetical protein GCM10019059_33030 [Camelimonas fluminis]|uniref:Uncharacterized protein n=1 Tax=Camelimonas fluminis TaxID=1576911 RepID=A0ABV7UFP5_9HYPH|nr:hypothetical protein [Camelimonas fluminis]GHE70668.1 hypothetical protein GCM10019059_33030 [Camelimonas fluminis]